MKGASVFVSTVPFATISRRPLELLEAAGFEISINPLGRRLQSDELDEVVGSFDYIVAGTEKYNPSCFNGSSLKMISRVGIGLDGIPLNACRNNGIAVSYTPDAPAEAVYELCLGRVLDALRRVSGNQRLLSRGSWVRHPGLALQDAAIGVCGVGRVGGRVVRALHSLGARNIIVKDVDDDAIKPLKSFVSVADSFEELIADVDVLSLNVPNRPEVRNLLNARWLSYLRDDVAIINTARGELIDERALHSFLVSHPRAVAYLDTFAHEPYAGLLLQLGNCYCTSHIGSMTSRSRARMELEAVEEIIRHARGDASLSPVPDFEYDISPW